MESENQCLKEKQQQQQQQMNRVGWINFQWIRLVDINWWAIKWRVEFDSRFDYQPKTKVNALINDRNLNRLSTWIG